MICIHQIKMKIGHSEEQLKRKAAELLHIPPRELTGLEILRQSVDARKKPDLFYIYTVAVQLSKPSGESEVLAALEKNPQWKKEAQRYGIKREDAVSYCFPQKKAPKGKLPPVIVGMGPAGLFCGYFLALHGYSPLLLERGRDVDCRRRDVERFWEEGILNPSSNVQFGEGGAGTFSDGKLNTLVKDKDGRNREVLETLVRFGAPASIVYEAKPHIGTDVLCGIVKRMREEILRLGGRVRFESRVTDLVIQEGRVAAVVVNGEETIPCAQAVFAIGHSARDTFSMLYEKKVPMEAKAFAVGLRVEHPQEMINKSQYGVEEQKKLGAASYKLAAKASGGRGVYSFCMCPGGYVVNASSEEGALAVNGMSYSGRDGRNANSAIVVTVTPADFGSDHPLAGIAFQRELEKRAYRVGKGQIPVQRYGDFKKNVTGCKAQNGRQEILPACKGAWRFADVSHILPGECNEALVEGMEAFGRQIKGFNGPQTLLSGVESRTSSPVRMIRDETLQSAVRGLYPCGEGAGYAGGITSAAMDGLRTAEAVAVEFAD